MQREIGKCPLAYFQHLGEIKKKKKTTPVFAQKETSALWSGFSSRHKDTPALVQCLQRFRAPKVGCASSSLNSSEHGMGLFAAPGAEEV